METEKIDTDYIKKHLGYELQMLLGAAVATKVFDEYGLGNVCSITRDSIYVHTRNLLYFFCYKSSSDRSIKEFQHAKIKSPLSLHEFGALNSHVMHSGKTRSHSKTNDIDLPAVALRFADDIVMLWKKWITDAQGELKDILREILTKAQEASMNTEKDARRLKDFS